MDAQDQADPTGPFRRHAVWLFPGVLLFHTLLIYGICTACVRPSLFAAAASTFLGLRMRWVRNVTTLLAFGIFLLAFLMLYVMGILGPVAFLVLSEQRQWVPWIVLGIASLFAVLLGWRFRACLRREWTAPLEHTPGVTLNPEQQTIVRQPVPSHSAFATTVIALGGVVFVVLMIALGGSPGYHVLTFGVGPLAIALFGLELVARGAAYYWVVKQWETKHAIRLKVPALR